MLNNELRHRDQQYEEQQMRVQNQQQHYLQQRAMDENVNRSAMPMGAGPMEMDSRNPQAYPDRRGSHNP